MKDDFLIDTTFTSVKVLLTKVILEEASSVLIEKKAPPGMLHQESTLSASKV